MDLCVDEAKSPAALNYLRQIGVDPGRSVRMIVVTHWHDDHIRGIAQVVSNCPEAAFVCPAAFRDKEFLTLKAALIHLADQMPRPMDSKTAVPPPTPNHLSIALLVQLERTAILLGGDVHRFDDRKRGWLRIADLYTEYGHPVSDVVKIPHHGSAGADADEIWDRLLRERPIAALTPFQHGRVSLRKAGDISRICGRTKEAYITALPRRAKPRKRNPAVDKTIEDLLRNRRQLSPRSGRVTLRSSSHERPRWTAQLAGAARRLQPGAV